MIKKIIILSLACIFLLPSLSIAKKAKGRTASSAEVRDSEWDPLGDTCPQEGRCTFYRKAVLSGNVPVELQIVSLGKNRDSVNRVFDYAISEVSKVAALLNPDDPLSEVSLVNDNAGKNAVEVGPEFMQLITAAKKVYLWTDGTFDISATPDIGTFEHIKIKGNTVYLKKKGMKINFNNMIHGYMADLLIQAIYNANIDDAIAISGHASRSLGKSVVGPWRTEVLDTDGTYAKRGMTLDSAGLGVASVVRGENAPTRDPRWATPPFVPSARRVTILGRNAAVAEALAYGIYVIGPYKGMLLINSLMNVRSVIVDNNGSFIKSPGL